MNTDKPIYDAQSRAEIKKWREFKRGFPPKSQILQPGPDQESVWDYPRPPCFEKENREGKVFFAVS